MTWRHPTTLRLPDGMVDLSCPKRDFQYQKNICGTAAYFCTTWEYIRDSDLTVPGGTTVKAHIPMAKKQCSWGVIHCPAASLWILNTVSFLCNGIEITIHTGPNYLDPLQGHYTDIWVAGCRVWTRSPHMAQQMGKQIQNKGQYVIEN